MAQQRTVEQPPGYTGARNFDPAVHCGQVATSTGTPCKLPKGYRTDHLGYGWCHRHLGCTPQGKRMAQREKLAEVVDTYGLPVDISPEQALLDEVQRTAGHVVWLGQRIRAMDPDQLFWGRTRHTKGREARGSVDVTEHAATVSVTLEMYHRERTHLVKVSAAAIAAGISYKALELAQTQATGLVRELRWLVAETVATLRLPDAKRDKLEGLVGQMLDRMANPVDGANLIAVDIIQDGLTGEGEDRDDDA